MTPTVSQILLGIVIVFALKTMLLDMLGFGGEPAESVNIDRVKELLAAKDPNLVLIDVRERSEFAGGHIPGAVNIPWFTSSGSLGLEPEEFEKKMGFKKPSADQQLLFYCRSGSRSSGASKAASKYGYTKRMNYPGSFSEWAARGESIEK